MGDEEKDLRNAVKNAKSAFYKFKGKKKKITRKETRRAARLTKKSKQQQFQLKKYNAENLDDTPDKTEVAKKKRKRKKKKKKTEVANGNESMDNTSYEAANKADEKLIASLGKKLGVNKKKDRLAPILQRDGLDYILELCEPLGADSKGYGSDEEYLASKSKKKKADNKVDGEKMTEKELSEKLLFEDGGLSEDDEIERRYKEETEEYDEFEEMGEDEDIVEDDIDSEECGNLDDLNDEIEEESDGYISDEDVQDDYRDTVGDDEDQESSKQMSKYIPPALRNQKSNNVDQKKLNEARIRKKMKGLLNRLSEGTIPGIVSEIEGMYSSNGRNFMNELFYEMVYEACVSTITTPERLVLQNMVVVAALQLLTNSEVGSYFLQMLAEKFSNLQKEISANKDDKSCHNVLLMLICLYNLKVVDSLLIYDLINVCLETFSDKDISLVFLIVKSCGPDIRKDDPAALKEMIVTFRSKCAEIKTDDRSYVNFMLEAIDALKNNNIRKIPLYDPTVVEDARKCLKAVLGKNKTIEVQLKVSLKDLIDAEEKGRWWITGSAWTGRGPVKDSPVLEKESDNMNFCESILQAAKKQRMNTNVRKQVFCVMVSSEDYIDAFEKLLKLNLKEKQFREVIHVMVDCCLQERSYNPFYSHLANKFCDFDKSNAVTLQYSLWDRFKTIPTMKKYSLSNMGQFLAHMIASKSLSLSVLKVVAFGALDKVSIDFFSNFFTTLLLKYPQNSIKIAFQRISNIPKLSLLKQGIKLFLRHFLYPDENTKDSEININKEKMRELIEVAELALDGCDYVPL